MPDAVPEEPSSPPRLRGLKPVLERNISALAVRRARENHDGRAQDKAADAITRFIGSMPFIYIHGAIVVACVAVNLGVVPGAPVFDKSFVILATAASVEAIFLSTFVLISQNRSAAAADRRADLDLQISLLAEHEVSRLIELTAAIARKVGVDPDALDEELEELAQDVKPESVMDDIDAEAAKSDRRAR